MTRNIACADKLGRLFAAFCRRARDQDDSHDKVGLNEVQPLGQGVREQVLRIVKLLQLSKLR